MKSYMSFILMYMSLSLNAAQPVAEKKESPTMEKEKPAVKISVKRFFADSPKVAAIMAGNQNSYWAQAFSNKGQVVWDCGCCSSEEYPEFYLRSCCCCGCISPK